MKSSEVKWLTSFDNNFLIELLELKQLIYAEWVYSKHLRMLAVTMIIVTSWFLLIWK